MSFLTLKVSVPLFAVAADTAQSVAVDETSKAALACASLFATLPLRTRTAAPVAASTSQDPVRGGHAAPCCEREGDSDEGSVEPWRLRRTPRAETADVEPSDDRDVEHPSDDLKPRHRGHEADGRLQDRGERPTGGDRRRDIERPPEGDAAQPTATPPVTASMGASAVNGPGRAPASCRSINA